MKCQRCPKQATLHITEVLGEERFEEVHLCEDCAKKYLYEPQQKKQAKANPTGAASAADEDAPAGPRCPSCGITFLEFRNHGRFGCAHDYDAFKADLLGLMESVHGDTKHAGKTPRRAPRAGRRRLRPRRPRVPWPRARRRRGARERARSPAPVVRRTSRSLIVTRSRAGGTARLLTCDIAVI